MGPHRITRATRDHRATNVLSIAIAPPNNERPEQDTTVASSNNSSFLRIPFRGIHIL